MALLVLCALVLVSEAGAGDKPDLVLVAVPVIKSIVAGNGKFSRLRKVL